MRLLIEHGADVCAMDRSGATCADMDSRGILVPPKPSMDIATDTKKFRPAHVTVPRKTVSSNPLARPGSIRDRYMAQLLAQLSRAFGMLLVLILAAGMIYEIATQKTTGEHASGDLEL
eukprot:SAG31_NODE_99_length_25388_cov_12.710507_8_plen_118_part_00